MKNNDLPSFDELLSLAQQDPNKLESLRKELVASTINSAPDDMQERLKGLQFTIDMEVRRSKNPMSSCMKLSELMHESFGKLRTALGNEGPAISPNIDTPADVICFESAKSKQA